MNSTQPSPLEKQLSAYADGELGESDRHDLEAQLVNDPQVRSVQDALKRGADHGRRAFDDMLKEPVPLDLVRTIKNAPLPRKAIRMPQPQRLALPVKPTGAQAFAACLIFMVLGGGIGYMFGARPMQPDLSQLASPSDSRDWFADIVDHYRLFSRPGNRLVEIPAERPADILDALTTNTGVSFRIPDLTDNGLIFQGARMFSAAGMPAGQLFYRSSDDGDIISIVFTRSRPNLSPTETIRDNIRVVSWSGTLATYAVVGPSSDAALDEIAAKAAGLI